MRFASFIKAFLAAAVMMAPALASAQVQTQTKVNPHTQIRWPAPSCLAAGFYSPSSNTCLGAYTTIKNAGAALPSRPAINWLSGIVSCVDNAGTTSTDCNLSSSGVAPAAYTNPTLSVDSYGRVTSASSNPFYSLAIGTITTGAPGSPATVTITGTPPTQTISFSIPSGLVGGSLSYPNVTTDGDSGLIVQKKITAGTLAAGASCPAFAPSGSICSNGVITDYKASSSYSSPFFTGVGLTAFGDSITVGYGPNAGQGYMLQSAPSFGLPYTNLARVSDFAADMTRIWVFPYTASTAAVSPNYTIMIGTNDAAVCGAPTGCQLNYTYALQAAVSNLLIPQTYKTFGQSCTATGTATADNTIPGVPAKGSTTNGTVLTCVTRGGGTKVDVAWRAIDSNAGVATLAIDGTNVDTLNAYGNSGVLIHTTNNTNDTIYAKQYTVPTASTHTVTFTVTSATGASNLFSVVYVATPNTIFTGQAPPRLAIMGLPTPQGDTIYTGIAQAVAATYANLGLPVIFIPTASSLNYATDLVSTPTNYGGVQVSDAVCTAGSYTLSSATANFGPNAVGQNLDANGCGAAGGWLDAVITARGSATSVTLNTAASTTASTVTMFYGNIGQVCGPSVATPYYLHGNNCLHMHLRDALLAATQPVTQFTGKFTTITPQNVSAIGATWSGSGGTNPIFLYNSPSATAPVSTWPSASNYPVIGINLHSTESPYIMDVRVDGGSTRLYSIDRSGNDTASSTSTRYAFKGIPSQNSASNPALYLDDAATSIEPTWGGAHPAYIGINAPGGVIAPYLDFRQNGGASLFSVDHSGNEIGAANTHTTYNTTTNCAVNSTSPAACGSAAAGAVVVPTTVTTYVINTTAVTAASRIMIFPMSFAGNLPSSPACVAPALTNAPTVSAITAGNSFTLSLPSTTGQTCWMYSIVD